MNRDVKRKNHWFIGSFSPSCSESRFIGEGHHVYSTPINKYPKAPVALNPDLAGRGDMCIRKAEHKKNESTN